MMIKMIIHNTIATIFAYICIRFIVPYFIPNTRIVSESGLPEIIAIVVWVVVFFKILNEDGKKFHFKEA